MALPIEATPVLEGEEALRLEAYMAASETHKERVVPPNIDRARLAAILDEIMVRRRRVWANQGIAADGTRA